MTTHDFNKRLLIAILLLMMLAGFLTLISRERKVEVPQPGPIKVAPNALIHWRDGTEWWTEKGRVEFWADGTPKPWFVRPNGTFVYIQDRTIELLP